MLEFVESPEYALALGLVLSNLETQNRRISMDGTIISKFFRNLLP